MEVGATRNAPTREAKITLYMEGVEVMMIYRTKGLALEVAMSDEVPVRVEAGWMLIPRVKYRKWKRR